MSSFDMFSSSLEGVYLIDASAGTGKTYTISGLVLRLLLEEKKTVQQILVVTYTEAAKEDLKTRIRQKISQVLQAISEGISADPFCRQLLARITDQAEARSLLSEALRNFDEAAVYTIHGFCQRMLQENSLESGVFFDKELVTDQGDILRQIAEDFFRKHFYEASPLFVQYAGEEFLPGKAMSQLSRWLSFHNLLIIPAYKEDICHELGGLEADFMAAFERVCLAWAGARNQVEEIFLKDPSLHRNKYRLKSIPDWLVAMDGMAADRQPGVDLFDRFEKFTARHLAGALKAGGECPVHPFFDLCDLLAEAGEVLKASFERCVLALKNKLYIYAGQELRARKDKLSLFAFDDLLNSLHAGLKGQNGAILARRIISKYPVALIDEFQDTDPVQYEIFKDVYQQGQGLLYLIGDPKQAIYSFRGADIYAYIQAVRDVPARYGLEENWRSVPGLIQAVNSIFGQVAAPFVFDEIPFVAARAADKEHQPLLIKGREEAPFQICLGRRTVEDDEKRKLVDKQVAHRNIMLWLVAEIGRLLKLGQEKQAMLGERPLAAGDIAVLVRTNHEARLVQKALAENRIASVLHSSENIFSSREARQLRFFLAAVAEPRQAGRLKAALAGDLFGLNGEEIFRLQEDERGWLYWQEKFRAWHELWLRTGFIRMFRAFVDQEHVRGRLLALTGGERRLTNFLHLMELVHRAAVEKRLGPDGVVQFLSDQISLEGNIPQDEYQLRLESDADRVQIVTIHKAKGLQYPVVFCPFSWEGSRLKKGPFCFHPPGEESRIALDLGSPNQDEHKKQAGREELAENLRLLYVALTRAVQRCYLVWGGFKGADSSAPAYLFHREAGTSPAEIATRVNNLADQEIRVDLERVVLAAAGSICLTELGNGQMVTPELPTDISGRSFCREFSGMLKSVWRIASFSSLSFGQHRSAELPDLDGDFTVGPSFSDHDAPERIKRDIFTFPRGAGPGVFMHDLFERLDFAGDLAEERAMLVSQRLEAFGFAPEWHETINLMVKNVLNAPLDKGDSGSVLSALPRTRCLSEMEFYFPIKDFKPDSLATIFAGSGRPWTESFVERLAGLGTDEISGFMKGFIDLVFERDGRFYILDWKSNYLGDRIEDYGPAKLTRAMVQDLYILQYHIYTVALDKYLATRIPGYSFEKYFGGIYYLFLRGVDPRYGPDFGIFRDRPACHVVEGFGAILG
ncbi:MAG: exodeoxyribonuclease V subunit beta [Proteobacteria bacterium]|nr:exodeoxyribonuclease V subunit beta [Pseudomonadota bacterium]MBU1717218.1 exodeoxyribonuclease V subunit beta [Pseudomonadota bacterium]